MKDSLAAAALVLRGYRYRYARASLALEERLGPVGRENRRLVMGQLPLNGEMDKLFEDVYSPRMAMHSAAFAPCCAIVMEGETLSLTEEELGQAVGPAYLLEQAQRWGGLLIRPSRNRLFARARRLLWTGSGFTRDGEPLEQAQALDWLAQLPPDTLLLRDVAPASGLCGCDCPVLHLRLLNHPASGPELMERYVAEHQTPEGAVSLWALRRSEQTLPEEDPRAAAAMDFVRALCARFRELSYVNVACLLTQEGFTVFQIDTGLDLCMEESLPPRLRDWLTRRRSRPEGRPMSLWRILRRYGFAWVAHRKGFINFMYSNWLRGLREDNALRCTTAREKHWAHKRGFYSYHIQQYHMTEENYHEFLSDYDYKRIRPLNSQYRKWFWDKLMSYYVLQDFPGGSPVYYARVIRAEGRRLLVPFAGWEQEGESWQLPVLLRRVGRVAVKPAVGSHGKGFHKVEYADGRYLLDGVPVSEQQVQELAEGLRPGSILSEYVQMHSDLKRIYDKVVCTIRVMTIRDGRGSPVKHAYLRVGTASTGNTDNLASGGVVVHVDVDTGLLSQPEILRDHRFQPCPIHPDTGAEICGTIPHWSMIRSALEDICRRLCVLEYLGFDIAVTQDGFRILEINTHQDLHKYPEYPQEVKDYLQGKKRARDQRHKA